MRVATGPDQMVDGPVGGFQVVRIHKHGGAIRLIVDDIVSVAWDDEGKAHGPGWNQSGWIGLRRMGHPVRCEYDFLKVYPLNRCTLGSHAITIFRVAGNATRTPLA